jgi:hypothetical protein
MPLLVRFPATCTLLAWRTAACIEVTSAVEVGSAGGALVELLVGALLPHAEIRIAAHPATPTVTIFADRPITG